MASGKRRKRLTQSFVRNRFTRIAIVAACCIVAIAFAGCSRGAARAEAQPAPASPLTYIGQWGAKGSGPGELDDPTCIAADSLGNIYLADDGSHFIHKFGPTGEPRLSFQDPGLKAPQSIAIDSGGAIYVTDASRGTVTIYLPKGTRYRSLRRSLRVNTENALDVAVDDDGRISVFDSQLRKIFTFTPRFSLIRQWQPAANVPNERVLLAAMTGAPDGSLYFVDPQDDRILHFDGSGHFISAIDANSGAGARKLSDRIAASNQYVFVMDDNGRTLHVWSSTGKPQVDVDLAPELGQAPRPAPPIAVSPRKELLVLDTPESRVLRYRINF